MIINQYKGLENYVKLCMDNYITITFGLCLLTWKGSKFI